MSLDFVWDADRAGTQWRCGKRFGGSSKNSSSNPVLLCQTFGQFIHSTLLHFTQLYNLTTDSGGYVCTISLCILITPCLDAFQRCRECVQQKGLPGSNK